MKHLEDAVEAKEAAPGTEIDGHKIRVDYSVTQRAHTPTPGQYMGRTTGGYRGSRRMPYTKRAGHRSVSRSRSRSLSYSPRRDY
jgi:transformer-2 protein